MENSLYDFTSKNNYSAKEHSSFKILTNLFNKQKEISNINLLIIKISMISISLYIIYFPKDYLIQYYHSFTQYYLNKLNLENLKVLTLRIIYLDYSYSLKYKIAEVNYCINFYDEYNNSIIPSKLSLLNFHIICHMKSKLNINNFETLANIYENKYFCCLEYFNIREKIEFGIKVYNTKTSYNESYEDLNFSFFKDNIFNFKDIHHKNDSKFDPLLINKEYTTLENKILSLNNNYEGEKNEIVSLKKSYIINPVCSPKTRLKVLNNTWIFENIYNHYFCFCKGINCFSKINIKNGQRCKYNFYLSIIDNNRYLYKKTEYLLADFFYEGLPSDDAYPIFKEMLKSNLSVHYMTQNRNIYAKHCQSKNQCQIIINEINIDGDFLEKYLELILRLKAIIAGSDFVSMDYIFYNIEYITSINLGHGVKYFKSFLYKEYTSPKKYNKLVLVPSRKIIAVALKYGWKEENIIKICLPKWDKYDNKKEKDEEIGQSIFIFFTWRNLKKGKEISSEYISNMLKIINSEVLNRILIKKNISLHYTLHPGISQYEQNIKNQSLKSNYINNDKISNILMKSNLLITDFSSVTFDFIYQRKPIIIYIPDSEDLNIKDNYDDDYYNLINSMKNGTIHFENKYNTTDQVINKIIYYIDNNFKLELKMKEFYDSFEFKCRNNTQLFIEYIQNMI